MKSRSLTGLRILDVPLFFGPSRVPQDNRAEGMRILRLSLVLSAAVLLLGASSAGAISFELTSDHCTGGCGTPPFGTVTLNQNGANVDITVHLFSPNFFVKTGAADFQNFKFNAVDVVVGDITVDQTVFGQTLAAQTGAFNGDGTGEFDFGIACTTCGNGASGRFNDDIVFHVASATIAELTVPNNLGNILVADIFSSDLDGLSGTGNTGPVDAVPEPGTAALTLVGLLGLAGWCRMSAQNRVRVVDDGQYERDRQTRPSARSARNSRA